jgi:hypothetical protein
MRVITSLAARAVAVGTLLVASGFVSAPSAHADYGHAGTQNVWQVGMSFNCNNASFCGADGLGGFWGWVQLNQDPNTGATSADAELTGCGHTTGGGGFAGAGHESVDVTGWFIAPGSAGPHTFWATGGTQTSVGHGTKVTEPLTNDDGSVVTPANPNDSGIPADPGHYSTAEILGFSPPPGVAMQIQVAYKPAR